MTDLNHQNQSLTIGSEVDIPVHRPSRPHFDLAFRLPYVDVSKRFFFSFLSLGRNIGKVVSK